MLEDTVKTHRKKQEASDLHRWTMLRMAINEDKCHTLAKKSRTKTEKKPSKSKESKEPSKMSSLFQDLPSLAAIKTWKSKARGDIRQRYGGKTEWDNGLTDSAYLMYGIPRATLKQDYVMKLKERHLRKRVSPRSINYSQSFSHYSTPMEEQPYAPRNRHSMTENSAESSISTLSSNPSSPCPVRVPKLPPNSVSVLPAADPKLVNLYHVKPKNANEPLNAVSSRSDPVSQLNTEIPKQNGSMPSGVIGLEHKINSPAKNTLFSLNGNKNNNNNNNLGSLERKTARVEPDFTPKNANASTQTLPKAGRTKVNPVSPTQVNFNRPISNNVLVDVEVQTDRKSPEPAPAIPIPPAPKLINVPIHKRPPHPAPKPKSQAARIHQINMAPLHEALMGSLNKRLQRQLLKANLAV